MAGINPDAIWKLIEKHKARAEDERREWDQYDSWLLSEFWDSERVGESFISPTVAGTMNSSDDDLALQTNYAYAFIDTMVANVCPSNPQMSISATVPEAKDVAAANEAIINATFRRNKVHDLLWEACTHTAISGRSILRTVWNEKRGMPTTYVVDPRSFFYDSSVPWESTRYCCEAVPLTEAEWKDRQKRGSGFRYHPDAVEMVRPAGYPKWLKKHNATRQFREDDASKEHFNWVVIYEFYDFAAGMYYQLAEDVEQPLMSCKISELFQYMRNPYTLIIFNKRLREHTGVSDVKLIASNQRRLNELDSLELQHVHTSMPVDYVNTALIDNVGEFIDQINGGLGPNDIVRLEVREGVGINQVLQSRPASNLSTAHAQMRNTIVKQIEFTLGIPAYSRGDVTGSDVATAYALADTATRTRNGRRIKVVSDAVVDIGKKYGALWQEHIGERQFQINSRADDLREVIVNASELGVSDPGKPELTWEDTWFFEFDAVPFSPAENHRLVQLNKMQTFLEPLMQMPNVDKRGLIKKLLELLGFDDIFTDEQPMPAQPQMGGLPQGAENPDTIASGAMPEGADFEDLSAVDARPMAQQPMGGT